MSSKVIPMHSKPTNTKKLVPEAGWELHTPYGTLKDIRGNSLVRLETVHALLMVRKGLTAAQAAAHVFGPFIADGNSELGMKHGADKLRPYLQIVDLTGCAFSVSDFAGVGCMEKLAELMPYVPHHHFDEGTPQALFYALSLMAGEAWAPHGVDVDLNDRLEDYGAEGYFPTMAKAREILGPFAVRHDLAHQLWGWGTVGVAVEAVASSSNAVSPPTPDAIETITFSPEFVALCVSRSGRKGDSWPDQEKHTLWKEICSHPSRKQGLREALAKALGLKDAEAVSKVVRGVKRTANTGSVIRAIDGKRVA